jgi:hypothetical protein
MIQSDERHLSNVIETPSHIFFDESLFEVMCCLTVFVKFSIAVLIFPVILSSSYLS